MSGAASVLVDAVQARLSGIGELAQVSDGPPRQAATPYAVLETGAEADWSHKTGRGREVRLAVTIFDRGERPERLRRLLRKAEAELETIGGDAGGWHIVSLVFLRSKTVADTSGGWSGSIDYRARLLATAPG